MNRAISVPPHVRATNPHETEEEVTAPTRHSMLAVMLMLVVTVDPTYPLSASAQPRLAGGHGGASATLPAPDSVGNVRTVTVACGEP